MITKAEIVSIDTDSEAYHAAKAEHPRGSFDYPISWTALKEFGTCPARWVAGYSSPDSSAKRFGSLVDCLLLTPGQFNDRYAIRPTHYTRDGIAKPWNGNAKECGEWIAENAAKIIVSQLEIDDANAAIFRLKLDPIASSFLDASDKQVLIRGEWQDEETGIALPIECLIDLLPRLDTEFAKCVGDLKTGRNAAILPWQRFCFQLGYHNQAAFNMMMVAAAEGEKSDRNTFCWIIQENYAPWQPAKRMLSQELLGVGQRTVTRLLQNYCVCLKNSRWPDYDETDESVQGWSVVNAEPFMEDFGPRFDFGAAEQAPEEMTEEIIP